MTYEIYKLLHILGLLLLLFGLFGMAVVIWNGASPSPKVKKYLMMSHGFGLALLMVAGFGMAARLGLMAQMPGWIYVKIFIWICLGGLATLIRKKPERASVWILSIFVLVAIAASMATLKPF